MKDLYDKMAKLKKPRTLIKTTNSRFTERVGQQCFISYSGIGSHSHILFSDGYRIETSSVYSIEDDERDPDIIKVYTRNSTYAFKK